MKNAKTFDTVHTHTHTHGYYLEKGITLIALVLTIILLLILAGVTLKIVIDNNFVEKTQTAVDKYAEQQAKEKLNIAIMTYKILEYSGENEKTFEDTIKEIGGEIEHKEAEGIYKVKINGYEFEIDDKELEIKESTKPIEPEKPEEKTKYILTFDANGGSVDITSKEVTYNEIYGDLPTPTKTDHTFAGWYTEAGTKIKNTDTVKITENTTLIAHWTANNQDPVLNTVSVVDRGTDFIKFKANATDADKDNLIYKVYLKTTSENYPTIPNATISGTQGTDAVLNVNTGLSEYTIYDYKVEVTDEKTTNEISTEGTTGTGCSGIGETKTCTSMNSRTETAYCYSTQQQTCPKRVTLENYSAPNKHCSTCGQETLVGWRVSCEICGGNISSGRCTSTSCSRYKTDQQCISMVTHREVYHCSTHGYTGIESYHTYQKFKDYYCSTHNVSSSTNSHTYTDNCVHGESSLHFPN